MKYLAIDYGGKRIGIAVSDVEGENGISEGGCGEQCRISAKIADLCRELEIGAIVIGESKDYKGEDNKINPKIIAFKRELGNSIKLPMFLEPEFMSSMQVEKTFGKTDMLDASAASIILQTFLDKEKNRQEKKKLAETPVKSDKISIDDFKKIEMTVGRIFAVEPIADPTSS